MVLGQLPPRKIAPNPKTNPNSNQGSIFLWGNCLVAPNPKANANLDRNLNPNREGGGNFPRGEIVRIPINMSIHDQSL